MRFVFKASAAKIRPSKNLAPLSYLKYMLGPYGMAIGIIEQGAKVGAKALPGIRLNPVDFQPGACETTR